MSRFAKLAIVVVAVAVVVPALAVATRSSATAVWHNKKNTVTCGITNTGYSPRYVLCRARGLPNRSHEGSPGADPFAQLAATGQPSIVTISQDTYPAGATIKKLAPGTTWTARGVSCHVEARTALCFNADNHGFLIGNGHYRTF